MGPCCGERGAYGRAARKLSRKRRMKDPVKDPKAERLAAALRENLKRRKAQARSSNRVEPGGKNEV